MSERVPESATRRLRADRSRKTRDTPANATIGGIDLANATIGISGGISQNATIGGSGGISQTLQCLCRHRSVCHI